MSSKRYFFVHLGIFVALCGAFAVAGLSSYNEFLASRDRAPGNETVPGASRSAPDGERARAVPVLALSADTD